MDLDKLFRDTDWTERELAEYCGVSQPTMNRVRTETADASLGLVVRICCHSAGLVSPKDLPMSEQTKSDVETIRLMESAGRVFE